PPRALPREVLPALVQVPRRRQPLLCLVLVSLVLSRGREAGPPRVRAMDPLRAGRDPFRSALPASAILDRLRLPYHADPRRGEPAPFGHRSRLRLERRLGDLLGSRRPRPCVALRAPGRPYPRPHRRGDERGGPARDARTLRPRAVHA